MLDGLRVIDLSADVGGAFATRLLGVYGADVVLVEPPEGHAIRQLAPHFGGASDDPDASILAAYYHAGKRSITLDLDTAARQWLANAGYDPVYGARPLKRVIQRGLQNQLATQLLEGRINEGDTVHVSTDAEGLVVNGEAIHAEAAE